MTLSIIVPVYDVAAYLKPCLESIFAAVKKLEVKSNGEKGIRAAVEIICVDDGSTDGSGTILEEFKNRVQSSADNSKLQTLNFKLIHQANAGVSAARNAALDAATGDWIGFVDADDTISERWFEVALELIRSTPKVELVRLARPVSVKDEQGPTGMSKHEKLWIDRKEAVAKARLASVQDFRARMGEDARTCGLHVFSREGWPVINFIRRDFIGSLRFPTGIRLKEDVCFFVQLANRLTCWVEAEFPGYFYTRRDGSAVMRARNDEDSLKFVNEMLMISRVEVERCREMCDGGGCATGSGAMPQFSPSTPLHGKSIQDGVGRVEMERCREDRGFRRAVSTAIGYEFVQWAEERDPKLPYDPKTCLIRVAWRKAWDEGLIDLGDMPFFWRPCIWLWVRFGILWPAKITRRLRERLSW